MKRRTRTIFLSASIPEPTTSLSKEWPVKSDLCKKAIESLVRRIITQPDTYLVCAYNPTITPIMVDAYNALANKFSKHSFFTQVQLFQGMCYDNPSKFREILLNSHDDFFAGMFIGGGKDVLEEYDIFKLLHKKAFTIPIAGTGGAAKLIYECHPHTFQSDIYQYLDISSNYDMLFCSFF